METPRMSRWMTLSLFLGNTLGHYDLALYGLLAPVLAPLFFPSFDPLVALILTYAIIPLGIIVKPIGALVLGTRGDKKGRIPALSLSLTGMGLASFGMALIPTYQNIGIIAPLFLMIGRLTQNFFAAGESSTAAVFLLEQVNREKQDIYSSIFDATSILGATLASGALALLYLTNSIEEGWRWLFASGSAVAFVGGWIRGRLQNPYFISPKNDLPVLKLVQTYAFPFGLIVFASGFSYASYSIALVLMNSLVPLVTDLSHEDMLFLTTILLIADGLLILVFGYVAKWYGREKMMALAALSSALFGPILFSYLENSTFIPVIFIRTLLVIIGVWFSAPFKAWTQTLIPTEHRCTLISLGYTIGSQALGAPTIAISLWLLKSTGTVTAAAYYWGVLGLICAGGIYFYPSLELVLRKKRTAH